MCRKFFKGFIKTLILLILSIIILSLFLGPLFIAAALDSAIGLVAYLITMPCLGGIASIFNWW